LFDRDASCPSGVLVVAEAPNHDDTFSADKGYLTYDIETDPTGNFTRELLASVGLVPSDVLFTNAVLCLPALRGKRYQVTRGIKEACSPWLRRLIIDAEARVVVTLGAKALNAVRLIEDHGMPQLKGNSGKPIPWFGRHLLPLYHPGRLGRISRSQQDQYADISTLRNI
jgi:uracil-DNA glycosylase family 4